MPYYQTLATHSVAELSESEIGDLNFLLVCVSSTARALTRDSLAHILEHTVLVVVRRYDGVMSEVCAMGFMTPVHSASAYRMYVNDIAVSPQHRRQGLAREVVTTLLSYAKAHHAQSVDLTSNPDREAAHALYASLGFKVRETNVYRFLIPQEESPDE